MLVLLIASLSLLFVLTPVAEEITHECSYVKDNSYTYLWTSVPPLLTGETSATVYFCSASLSTLQIVFGNHSYSRFVYVRAAIRQIAPAPSSEWNYTDIIRCSYCDDYTFMAYLSIFIPYQQHYVNLMPNTLYSVVVIGCFRDGHHYLSSSQCTIGNSSGYVVEQFLGFVSTRPQVPACYIEPYSTAIEIIFRLDSSGSLGLLAHGYEVAVWQIERENTMTLKVINYFPAVDLPTYRVTVSGLTSSMMYLVQVRANGSHIPNMKSAWVETRIQTLAHGPSVPNILQHIQRGNVVLLRLNSSDIVTYGVKHCQVELVTVSPVGSTNVTLLLNLTVSDHDRDGGHYLFIEGLAPNQEYRLKLAAVNEAGVSGFTEWVDFTTTNEVVHSMPPDAGGALLLQWTPPTLFDGESLFQYEVTLTPLGAGSAVQMRYTLPSTQSELTVQGLQEGVDYQVMIETRVDSGLVQPFYSLNITIPVAPASSAAVVNGVAGAGVTLLIVLACVAAGVGLLLVVVFLKRRKGGSKRKDATTKERSTAQRNTRGGNDEVKMDANPAYEAVEFDVGEGTDPQRYEARYHSREDAVEPRDRGGFEEGEGQNDGAGLGYDESRTEKAGQVFYENVTR